MPRMIRCWCEGSPECKLCGGRGRYPYEPGPMGYMPFPCPTCDGRGKLTDEPAPCPTCKRAGNVDPANPPVAGMWDILSKIFFGA